MQGTLWPLQRSFPDQSLWVFKVGRPTDRHTLLPDTKYRLATRVSGFRMICGSSYSSWAPLLFVPDFSHLQANGYLTGYKSGYKLPELSRLLRSLLQSHIPSALSLSLLQKGNVELMHQRPICRLTSHQYCI